MTSRSIRTSLLPLAAVALSGSIALAQQAPPQPPAAPDASGTAAERHAPPPPDMRGMRPHRAMEERGHMGGGFHGGPRGEMGGGFHIGPQGMWWKNPRVVQTLTLTPDQVKRMDGIFQESRLKLIDLRANVQKQEVMLEPILGANPLDAARAQAQIDKVADARAELEKANARMLLGIRGVLTPDQWTKLQERRERGGEGERGGPGGGPGRGRGPNAGTTDNLVEPVPDL